MVLLRSRQSQNKITMTKHLNTQKGFTLIELLMVIAIIGVMSAFFATNFATARNKATDAVRKSNLAQLQKALDLYYNTNATFPTTGGLWYGLADNATTGFKDLSGANGYIPNLAPTFLLKLPVDPSGDTSEWSGILYRSDGENYVILAHENGPKSFPSEGEPFYDPLRPTTAWKVTNNDPATEKWE